MALASQTQFGILSRSRHGDDILAIGFIGLVFVLSLIRNLDSTKLCDIRVLLQEPLLDGGVTEGATMTLRDFD